MNEEQLNAGVEIDLGKLFSAFLKKWWIIALAAILCGGAVFGFVSMTHVPAYESESMIYISSVAHEQDKTFITTGDINAATSLIPAYTTILESRQVYEILKNDLPGFDFSYAGYQSMVDASALKNTQILQIAVVCEDPVMAHDIADKLVDVMREQIPETIGGSSVTVVDRANMPTAPISSGIAKKTVLAFLAGLVLSMAVIAVFEIFFNDTLDSEDWLKETFGEEIPVLTVIPEAGASRGKKHGYHRYGYADPSSSDEKK